MIPQVSKLLKYLSSLQTDTSQMPPTAEAKLLNNASDLTSYFEKLSQPSINLKPRALKKELNAALHLVTFLRRSRDLLSTDRPFYDSLENTKIILRTFQEGTLKRINKDRNNKTTRNILEGLPFDTEDVKWQTKDEKLVADVEAVAEKYNGSRVCCHDVREYNLLMRYLIGIVIFNHFQQPSVTENLMIDEFVRAKQAKDDQFIVLVSVHKTGAQGPAQ